MKKTLCLLFLVLIIGTSQAQFKSPYRLSPAKDVTIPALSLGLLATAFFLEKKRPALTIDQINELDRDQIKRFDQNATHNWNKKAAIWSDVLLVGSMALPTLFLLDQKSRKDFGKISLVYSEIFLLNFGITNLSKELIKRKRPFLYNPNAPLTEKLKKDAQHSFFSGHTSITAAMTFGFAQIYHDYFPQSPAKPGIWFAASVVPLASAILRNRAGKHFWTDVIAGYVVGAAVGLLVPRLHLKKK